VTGVQTCALPISRGRPQAQVGTHAVAGLEGDDIVPSGGKYLIEANELDEVADASGIARVQCCIHPWMRTEVRMKG